MTHARLLPLVLLAMLSSAVMACASNHFDGHVFRNEEVAFELREIPANWRRLDAEGTLLSFRNDAAGSTIAVNARCGKDADDVPLQSLTQHLFLQFTERQIGEQQMIELAGREALRSELVAKLDGVRKHFIVVVLKKDGCVYDFVHITNSAPAAQDRETFEQFVQGFATVD
ncbi:MAG TPA: hypothetical protein VHO25_00925 [Polyangiaceae bacterium]|nr:hypothetical protein [Polyangiaceae bacterium]